MLKENIHTEKQIAAPREEFSPYAPQIVSTQIKVEKIKDVIGKGGETINKIIAATGVKIDIEIDDQGRINLTMKDLVEAKEEETVEVSAEEISSENE